MVVYRINEILQTGAVFNRTYRVGESVYLFSEFTINTPIQNQGRLDIYIILYRPLVILMISS